MAKDKNMQQASWEKKKDKLDKKKDNARNSWRKDEKLDRKKHKEEVEVRAKESKEGRSQRIAGTKMIVFRAVTTIAVLAIYIVALRLLMTRSGSGNTTEGVTNAEVAVQWDGFLATILTTVMIVAISSVCFCGADWQSKLAKEEEQKEVANHVKGQLERKQTEKERAERAKQRQLHQLKAHKERMQRREAEEKAAMQQASELARMLRKRREEREAEMQSASNVQSSDVNADDGEKDSFGWTAQQHKRLRAAVANYPPGWSHSSKRRWDMIAAEVGKKDARDCESTFARLEEADRATSSESRVEERRNQAQNSPAAAHGLDDDLDWLGGEDPDWFAAGNEDGGGMSDESDEEEDEGAGRERMVLELEPERKGTEIRLEGIKAMQGCATVQVELLHVQISCADCRTSTRVYLSGADEDSADAKMWCEGCSGLVGLHLRPCLLHRGSSTLCYVDCIRCNVTDMLPSVLMSVCENCNGENVHKQEFVRNRPISGTCFSCHEKYGFSAESIRIEQITPCDPGGKAGAKKTKGGDDDDVDPMDEIAEELRYLRKKAKSDPRQQLIQLGRPLPQNGACAHFKKSYKWYRFGCCGRAFPCPQCHIESGCPAAALGAHANRMICGKCSMEQSYSPSRPCEKCGFTMQAKGSTHWEDGAGTRNLAVMSTKDAKKFKGGLRQVTSKTKTQSAKASRVGVKAKAKREHQQKFGKDG